MKKVIAVLAAVAFFSAAQTAAATFCPVWPLARAPSSGYHAVLSLGTADIFVKPSHTVVVTLDVSALLEKVNGCQAIIGYDASLLTASSVAEGKLAWDTLIYEAYGAGKVDVSVGVDALGHIGVETDATVAVITFTPAGPEGQTTVWFRADVSEVESTILSSMLAEAIYPLKVNSPTITIDGTPPTDVSIAADPASWTNSNAVTLTFSATDPLSGIAGYELQIDSGAWFPAASPYSLDVSGMSDGIHTASVRATDRAGNSAEAGTQFKLDKTAPALEITSAKQGTTELTSGTPNAVQGVVSITVAASDLTAGLAAVPAVTVTPNAGAPVDVTASVVDHGDCTFTYSFTVTAATPNGLATINAGVADGAGNGASDSATFNVNKNQITGLVQLDSLAPVSTIVRTLVFKATANGSGVLKMWQVPVSFAPGNSKGSYTLTDVPGTATALSAKTAWNLRRKLQAPLDANGQGTANFTNGSKLLGGDIVDTNSVNLADYIKLKLNWLTDNDAADINGDGAVNLSDYIIMKLNWFEIGDPE